MTERTEVGETVEATKGWLRNRRAAYRRTFDVDNQDVQAILKDLAKFCRGYESTFDPDPRIHALLEGRKEVWTRIQQHLQLSDEDLWKLYTRKA